MTYNKAHLMNYENSITEAIYAVANNISELKNLSRGILRNCNKMKQIGNIFSGWEFSKDSMEWLSKDITKQIVQEASESNLETFIICRRVLWESCEDGAKR